MATQPLDVYSKWLGIKEKARPLNHYQLLRLEQFEDDAGKIRKHYRKMNAEVRKYASGNYARQSQDLLNELAKAMLCLTDERRKTEYDASLGRKVKSGPGKRSLEELLLARKVISPEQLNKARNYANAIGLDVRDAIVQNKMSTPDVVMQVYAESLGLPYVEMADLDIDPELVEKVPATIARQHSCAPVLVDEGQLLIASPNPLKPEVEDELRLRVGMPVRSVLCTVAGINQVVDQFFPKEKVQAEMARAAGVKTSAKQADPDAPVETQEEAIKRRTMITIICTAAVMFISMNFTNLGYTYGLPLTFATAAIVYGSMHFLKL